MKSLNEIANELKTINKKIQLIYAFNGVGKTRLSREFKNLVEQKSTIEKDENILASKKIIYYNAFTEDLFYWDNDLKNDAERKLLIRPNSFTKWIFEDQGQDRNVIDIFQHYTDEKLTPHFNSEYVSKAHDKDTIVSAFSEVTFTYERGNEEKSDNIKISKGEESCFVWSIFYSLLEQVIDVLNIDKDSIYQERGTKEFDELEYVFIDDPVTSLDENHLIEMAVNLADMIKVSQSDLKFVITTHNPLFYNVLSNEFSNKKAGYKPSKDFARYCLEKKEEYLYTLKNSTDSPFSYHLFLLNEINMAIEADQIKKFHFNFLRNILEKTSTFLGYEYWGDLISPIKGEQESYMKRILNLSSHSKHSAEEVIAVTLEDKRVLTHLVKEIMEIYKFKSKGIVKSEEGNE